VKKPAWLRQRAAQGEKYARMRETLGELKLNTVCVEAQCPNIGEVFNTHKHFNSRARQCTPLAIRS
jgi:lipoic acid synthetase